MTTTGVSNQKMSTTPNTVRARRLGIDTQQETVVFMRADCHICRSEGFTAHTRVRLSHGKRSVIATLYQISSEILGLDEAGLSDSTWFRLGLKEGAVISVDHPRPLESLSLVRAKVFGQSLNVQDFGEIIGDVIAGRYSDIHISSFITACSAQPLDLDETTALTRAMIDVGDTLSWATHPVADKHCVGGLPGNRTTPIVVAIVVACGLTMPKTSSRAITSPAGTADAMETMAPVDLDIRAMRQVVEREGGCIIWGGAVHLSPADDLLIRVERALDLDGEGQLVASVLSKKIAAGATHLVLDLPVGPTAKVRSPEAATELSQMLTDVAVSFGLEVRTMTTDGRAPVGRGIGPALEARDVLAVLRQEKDAPEDLLARSVTLAGALLELAGASPKDTGEALARAAVEEGRAWATFQRICNAQGGLREPPIAAHTEPWLASHPGHVASIDNRRIARAAKLAGAPYAKAAGIDLHVQLGAVVQAGEPLFTLHAEAPGELAYARRFVEGNPDIVLVEEA